MTQCDKVWHTGDNATHVCDLNQWHLGAHECHCGADLEESGR